MKRIRYIIIFLICLLIFSPTTSVYADEIEGWERALFLQEDDLDRIRLSSLYEEIEREVLTEYNAVADYSKAYVRYNIEDYAFLDCYNTETNGIEIERMNYDGLPSNGYLMRYIFVPVYQDDKLIGELRIDDWDDDIHRPYIDFSKTPCPTDADFYPGLIDDGRSTLMYKGFEKRTGSYQEWEYAKQGYAVVASMGGAMIQAIFCTADDYVIINTNEGNYIYPVGIAGEEEKGYQAIPMEDYIKALADGLVIEGSLPQPTPTPTPTPRPSRTAAVTPRPTVVTPTATPSAEETTTPALTAAASLLPSPSSAPEQSAGSTVLIVIGAALVIAAAGAVGWAVFRQKKGKE